MTRRAALLAPLLLVACGFTPVYAPGETGDRLRGRIAVEAPDTPDGFRLRTALLDRLGSPGPAPATLTVALEVGSASAGQLPGGGSARTRLQGRAVWRLTSATGATLAEGSAEGFTGATTTGPVVSTREALDDARERLVVLLADRIVARLLLLPPEALP